MFNESKYKKCINHLIAIKVSVIIFYILAFALIGAGIGIIIMNEIAKTWTPVIIGASTGALIGLILGVFSTWRIEMKIQESYWRIDVLNEIKRNSEIKNNNPIAKTVVAIENKHSPEVTSKVQKK